jgi:hypothetical protein
LFGGSDLAPDEKRIFSVLRADEPTPIDELAERLVVELSSSQIFAALFALGKAAESGHSAGEVLRVI